MEAMNNNGFKIISNPIISETIDQIAEKIFLRA